MYTIREKKSRTFLSADPFGHPDGWNNFAYCNGQVTSAVDWMGGSIDPNAYMILWYYYGQGEAVDTDQLGITGNMFSGIQSMVIPRVVSQIDEKVLNIVKGQWSSSGTGTTSMHTTNTYNFVDLVWVVGGATVSSYSNIISFNWWEYEENGINYRGYEWSVYSTFHFSDTFSDPGDLRAWAPGGAWIAENGLADVLVHLFGMEPPFAEATPYYYDHMWTGVLLSGQGRYIIVE